MPHRPRANCVPTLRPRGASWPACRVLREQVATPSGGERGGNACRRATERHAATRRRGAPRTFAARAGRRPPGTVAANTVATGSGAHRRRVRRIVGRGHRPAEQHPAGLPGLPPDRLVEVGHVVRKRIEAGRPGRARPGPARTRRPRRVAPDVVAEPRRGPVDQLGISSRRIPAPATRAVGMVVPLGRGVQAGRGEAEQDEHRTARTVRTRLTHRFAQASHLVRRGFRRGFAVDSHEESQTSGADWRRIRTRNRRESHWIHAQLTSAQASDWLACKQEIGLRASNPQVRWVGTAVRPGGRGPVRHSSGAGRAIVRAVAAQRNGGPAGNVTALRVGVGRRCC